MTVTSEITVFKTGYMGKYTNEGATPASETVKITIDGSTVQSREVEIPANDFVCLFGDWSGVDTSVPHEICAVVGGVVCPPPMPSFTHTGEPCT